MNIAIIGCGGHSKVIADLIQYNQEHKIIGYFDDKFTEILNKDNLYYGSVLSVLELFEYYGDLKCLIAIGDNKVRQIIVERLGLSHEQYITLVHNTAIISSSARIGHGTVIMANAVVQADSVIGNHSIINTGSVIEHDNVIGNFVHISPRSTLAGTVRVEDGVQIGAGATVIPNKNIGKWTIIGAGASVIKNIPSYCTAVGVPAKVKLKYSSRGGVING